VTNLRVYVTNIYSISSFCGVLVVKFELLVVLGGWVVVSGWPVNPSRSGEGCFFDLKLRVAEAMQSH
jgi:hypothetical protein